jgi:hypothetical protein
MRVRVCQYIGNALGHSCKVVVDTVATTPREASYAKLSGSPHLMPCNALYVLYNDVYGARPLSMLLPFGFSSVRVLHCLLHISLVPSNFLPIRLLGLYELLHRFQPSLWSTDIGFSGGRGESLTTNVSSMRHHWHTPQYTSRHLVLLSHQLRLAGTECESLHDIYERVLPAQERD